MEYDLFKTMILNIIDNARKADATEISIIGIQLEQGYEIAVSDNGRGIPKEDLNSITEAFFIVDKSRMRKQHGAGYKINRENW